MLARLPLFLTIAALSFVALLGNPASLIAFLLKVIFAGFLPGYVILSAIQGDRRHFSSFGISILIGLAVSVNLYALSRAFFTTDYSYVWLCVMSVLGGHTLYVTYRNIGIKHFPKINLDSYAIYAGLLVMLFVGSAFYSSGTTGDGSLVFHGPMSRDHIYHLAQIQRLNFHVPADNFIISGYTATGYHFFSDLLQFLLAPGLLYPIGVEDVYFKYYPSLIFFGIGYYCYQLFFGLFKKIQIAILGVVVVVLGADLSWLIDAVKVGLAIARGGEFEQILLTPWTDRHPFGVMYPLVHRPAHYHGLLFLLVALRMVTNESNEGTDKGQINKNWIVAGLILGLCAGFNFTLSGTMAISVAMVLFYYLVRKNYEISRMLGYSLIALGVAAAPIALFVLMSDSHSHGKSPLVMSIGAFPILRYGDTATKLVNNFYASSFLAVAMFMFVSYNLKLVGLCLLRTCWAESTEAITVKILLVSFVVSLGIGICFEFGGLGGINSNIIFLQPSNFILGLIVMFPVAGLMLRARLGKSPTVLISMLFGLLLLGPLQAIVAYNNSYKVVFAPAAVNTLAKVKNDSQPDDVIAFYPTDLRSIDKYGDGPRVNNFYFSALTGLRSFFSVDGYSQLYLPTDQNRIDYAMRREVIQAMMVGTISKESCNFLRRHSVSYVVLLEPAIEMGECVSIFDVNPSFTVYKII